MSAVYIWNSADSKNYRVTPEMFNASDPAWDPNGNYLYFISSREFAPQISNSEFNYATNRMGQIYALALRTDVKNPFPYESDEVSITEEKKPEALASPNPSSSPETRAADNRPERIDFSGIEQRVTKVPLPADNYAGLSANKGHLVPDPAAFLLRTKPGHAVVVKNLFSKGTKRNNAFAAGWRLRNVFGRIEAIRDLGRFLCRSRRESEW